MSEEKANLIYEIDKSNVIRKIGGSWEAFSKENNTHDLAIERVIGRSLWDFIVGKDVRLLYENVLRRLRQSGSAMQFPFRCDSPDIIRLMHMEILPLPEQCVRFATTPLEIRKRPEHVYYNYIAHGNRCHIFSCSICNRVKSDNAWLQLEQALQENRLLDTDKPLSMYGAVCPECRNKMDELISKSC